MNEKFFDLKKEKQDRIINAALKVFADNGYKHASTDEIVKEAGISKGLLFHYFTSKMGLYTFLYDYCVRFLSLEYKSTVSEKQTDYFKLMSEQEQAKKNILKSYPYMQKFIDCSQTEDDTDAVSETTDLRNELQDIYDNYMDDIDVSVFRKDIDTECIDSMLQYTLKGIMNEMLQSSSFNADKYYSEAVKVINVLKTMSIG